MTDNQTERDDASLSQKNARPQPEQIHSHFSPYQRISPPWNAYEVVKTIFTTVFLFPLRVLYLGLAALLLVTLSAIAMVGWPPSDPVKEMDETASEMDSDARFKPLPQWRRILISMMFPIIRSILFISMGVYRIKHEKRGLSNPERESKGEGYVIVANHLGYIDILVLMAMFRGSFVAKGELERAVIVGKIARGLQCMFVRKGHPLTTQLVARVQATYTCHRRRESCPGCPACMNKLVIFPEGTTTNGTGMIPFRTGVFNAGLPVKLVCIKFPYRRFNLSWETIRFREHLWRTMTQLKNNVEVTELPVYDPDEDERNDARLYAWNVQQEMVKVLGQEVTLLNRRHKFLYHGWLIGKEKAEGVMAKAEKLFDEDEQLVYYRQRLNEENV